MRVRTRAAAARTSAAVAALLVVLAGCAQSDGQNNEPQTSETVRRVPIDHPMSVTSIGGFVTDAPAGQPSHMCVPLVRPVDVEGLPGSSWSAPRTTWEGCSTSGDGST